MKKIIGLILVLALLFTLGCGGKTSPSTDKVSVDSSVSDGTMSDAVTSTSEDISDIESELDEIDSLDEELISSELDDLDSELDFEI